MKNAIEDEVRVSTGELVTLIALAASRAEGWPERATGVRAYLSDAALERLREVGQRLIDYAAPDGNRMCAAGSAVGEDAGG